MQVQINQEENYMKLSDSTSPKLLISLVFLFTLVYAITRYVVFGQISVANIPLFVTNKAASFSAILLFYISTTELVKKNKKKVVQIAIMLLIILHVSISFLLMSNNYYPKFFNNDKITFLSELGLLFGVISFSMFFIIWIDYKKDLKDVFEKLISYTTILICLHILCIGVLNWFTPSSWPGFIPPISLLSFLFGTIGFVKSKMQ